MTSSIGVLHFTCLFVIFRLFIVFFFHVPPTTEIYTLSLHALFRSRHWLPGAQVSDSRAVTVTSPAAALDRKSTRLNSSHANISYAVFCLKKKKIRRRAMGPAVISL